MNQLILATALGSGLMAGVFLAFSSFVMQALARLPEQAGIAAMQSINITVINPLFLGIFFGTALGSIGLLLATLISPAPSAMIIAGGILYLAGTFGVTVIGNVPLNNRLAGMEAMGDAAKAFWPNYIRRWSRWNHLRAVAATLATLAFICALRSTQV